MSPKPENFFVDDFNDNNRDTDRWLLLQVNGATASETNQRLQVTVPSGSGWAQAGYVTGKTYTLNEHIVKVNVPSCGDLNQMILQICTTKVTSSDPYSQNNWYRIMKTDYAHFSIQRRISGGSVETLQTFTSASQQLVIKIQDGVIKFYDDINLSNLRYSQDYALPSYDCYVYVFTSSQRDSAYGTGQFDDFAISPVIVTLNHRADDYNCYSGSTKKGGRGVTTWGPIDLPSPIAANGGVSPNLAFTPTQPKCYEGKDFCNLTFRIHAESSATNRDIGPIKLKLWRSIPPPIGGWELILDSPDYFISRTSGHDATLTIDLAPIPEYDDESLMYFNFTNNDPTVDIRIKELQTVRCYCMKFLFDQAACSGDQTQTGVDFATGHDYPCNYDKCGGMSYTGFTHDNHYFQQIVNGNQPDGAILEPGTTYSWQWTNPSATFPGFQGNTNYVAKAHCLFNFNNVSLCDDDGNPVSNATTTEVPFQISLDGTNWFTFYQPQNNVHLPHGIDLATHEYLKNYYNDAPGASNTLYLLIPANPDPGVNLFLADGETGLINLYRVYETKPCCPTISTAVTGSGTISPSGGPFAIPEQGKTFDMTPSGGGSLLDVEIDDVSKGPVDPYNVEWDDINLNLGMEGHEILAEFSTCGSCYACQYCLACYSCYISCQVGCEICQDCQTTCEISCQTACEQACQSCQTCQTACELSCQDCQVCVTCQTSETCPYGYYTCQGCETCQPGYT